MEDVLFGGHFVSIDSKTVKIIALTAITTALVTSTVKDVLYVQNNGLVKNKVNKVANVIENYSLYEVDEEKLADFAATGMSTALDDVYSNYFTKEQFDSFKITLSNSFYGVGIVISVDSVVNKLVVVSPTEGGPAASAGILPGDYIIAVDGVEYTGEEMNQAVSHLRGDDILEKVGTTVDVTVERNGEIMYFTIKRDVVMVDSVSEKMLDNGIGYIRITAFNSAEGSVENAITTYDEFMESLKKLQDSGMQKLVIDLRNNPGGSLDVVNKIADELLPEGVITYTVDKNGQRYDYTSEGSELGIPMAVLVNGGSASASEVLTGALKDYKRATVIGTKTFGKGVVQTVIPFTDGSGMSVTTSKYYSPNGVCIHGVGIEPDIVVEMDESKQISEFLLEEDLQLQKAIEVLN